MEDLSRASVVERFGVIFHRVLERTCPRLGQCMNLLEAVAPAKKKLSGRGQGVLYDGEMTVCRRRSQASEVS